MRVRQPVTGLEWTELIYPDVPCFLADGRSFVFHSPEGPMICYLEKQVRTRPLFTDRKPRHFVITPDGRFVCYTERNDRNGGTVTLFRKDLETFRTETVFSASGRLPGSKLSVKRFSRIQTVSSDNRRVATTGCCLGGRRKPTGPFGILVIDLDSGQTRLAAEDPDFGNPHVQYCRAAEEEASHDLMIQMNHSLAPVPGALGVDAHVVRDDGSNWRNLPWGRDGKESLIGHQIWRGNTRAGVTVTLENQDTSYGWADGTRQDVVAGWPVPAARDAHTGRLTRGASRARVELSKGFPKARFCHLGTDATGLRLALDTFPNFDGERAGMQVFFASARNERSPARFTYLLNSRNTFTGKSLHAHPILSPDGTMLLFNSAISGTRQFYLVTQFEDL
jgi:hypothetical protein